MATIVSSARPVIVSRQHCHQASASEPLIVFDASTGRDELWQEGYIGITYPNDEMSSQSHHECSDHQFQHQGTFHAEALAGLDSIFQDPSYRGEHRRLQSQCRSLDAVGKEVPN